MGGERVEQGRDSIELNMGKQGQRGLDGIEIKEEDMVGFIQFSEGSHDFGRLGGIIDEENLQFPPVDPSSLVQPFASVQHAFCTFAAQISPSATERNEAPHLQGGLAVSGIRKADENDERKKKE